MRRQFRIPTALLVLLLLWAAELPANSTTPYPLEPLDTSSPRATLQSLIDSSKEASSAYLRGDRKDARASARRAMEC
ncbi:MAG: hypothetical protein ACP5M0_12465, partial [Desulfomonilaceae bacterium]